MKNIEIHMQMDPARARLLFTVHDAYVFDVEDGYVEKFCELLKQVLTSPIQGFSVPLKADIKVGNSVYEGDLKKFEGIDGKLDRM
jgi:DNA polymerase I-like protein with 3'-5' exonuclease and polymerase domains